MPPRAKPKWKNPCIKCEKCARIDQKFLTCTTCKKRIHQKCIDSLSENDFQRFKNNESIFHCFKCKPDPLPNEADESFSSDFSSNTTTSYTLNDSDFEWVTDSDSDNESRGLNFDALPIQNTVPPNIFETHQSGVLPVRVMNFKYLFPVD